MKTIEESFIDWEASAFGYGYGTGEPHVLAALKTFMDSLGRGGVDHPHAYDYRELETALGPAVAWLLINALGRQDILEYGSSPRFGWLTEEGRALKEFMDSKTADELSELVCNIPEGYFTCSRGSCNCGTDGYEEGRVCVNPFWERARV